MRSNRWNGSDLFHWLQESGILLQHQHNSQPARTIRNQAS